MQCTSSAYNLFNNIFVVFIILIKKKESFFNCHLTHVTLDTLGSFVVIGYCYTLSFFSYQDDFLSLDFITRTLEIRFFLFLFMGPFPPCFSSLFIKFLFFLNQECIFNQAESCTFSNYGHFLSRYWATYNARLFKQKIICSYFNIIMPKKKNVS